MTRKIFDWHPELNIFAKNIKDKMVIQQMFNGEFRPPPQKNVGFIDANETADYYFQNEDKSAKQLDNIPIKPPWPITWLEYDVHKHMYPKVLRHFGLQDSWFGSYALSYDIDEEERTSILASDGGSEKLLEHTALEYRIGYEQFRRSEKGKRRMRLLKMLSQKHECHTILLFWCYAASRHQWAQPGHYIAYLDDRGHLIPKTAYVVTTPTHDTDESETNALFLFMNPLILTLGLLNCKNVNTRVIPNSGAQKKKYRRVGSPNIVRRTLVVKPAGAQYDDSGNKTGQKMPWHMCRGHFKTFTDEAPLFGRITGTYWWNAQVRGKKNRGEVHKDYLIEPEEVKG
jgi:hypothetical protein